jgi:xylulokinase
MWLEAMDAALARLSEALGPQRMQQIECLSACAQQHGSVFWDRNAMAQMHTQVTAANKHRSLTDLLGSCFSVRESPIWADSSTAAQCEKLQQWAGGAQQLAELTGSKAFERFTVAQILKIAQQRPQEFEDTCHISLISSFVASLMLGTFGQKGAGGQRL